MSFDVQQPVISETAAAKANKTGDDFTNPSTWRNRMEVPSLTEAQRLANSGDDGAGGVCVEIATTGNVIECRPIGAAMGYDDYSIWIQTQPPASNPSATAFLLQLREDSNNGLKLFISSGGDLRLLCRKGGVSSDDLVSSGFVAAYGGSITDIVIVRSGATSGATGTAIVYINGAAVFTSAITGLNASFTSAAILWLGAADTVSQSFGGPIYRAALFNRGLSAADVVSLCEVGISIADSFGTPAAAYSSAFASGVTSSFAANAGNTVTGITGPIGGVSGVLSVNSAATTQDSTDGPLLQVGRRYKITAQVFRPAANATGLKIAFETSGGTVFGVAVTPTADTWTLLSTELIWPAVTSMRFRLRTSGDSGTITAGDTFYLDDVVVMRVGAIIDLDFRVGVGSFFPDLTGNGLSGIGAGSISHLAPRRHGTMAVVRSFGHGDISSSSGTTKLLDLPPNCGIVRVEFDRTAAFDGGVTIDVGTAGSATKFIAAQAVSATGIVLASSADAASQSNAVSTAVYVKKSGSTTIGSVTLRVVYEIRG